MTTIDLSSVETHFLILDLDSMLEYANSIAKEILKPREHLLHNFTILIKSAYGISNYGREHYKRRNYQYPKELNSDNLVHSRLLKLRNRSEAIHALLKMRNKAAYDELTRKENLIIYNSTTEIEIDDWHLVSDTHCV